MLKEISDLKPNPLEQLSTLWSLAKNSEGEAQSLITLATANQEAVPSARIVLLKEVREKGIVFYSNYQSQKGEELSENPRATALLYWPTLDIQVRLSGDVSQLSDEDSDHYFASRDREKQIGAWASKQSRVLKNRQELEDAVAHYEEKFAGQEVPRPESWGGYLLSPSSVHFLVRRQHRLHDSFRYRLQEGGAWLIERLSP